MAVDLSMSNAPGVRDDAVLPPDSVEQDVSLTEQQGQVLRQAVQSPTLEGPAPSGLGLPAPGQGASDMALRLDGSALPQPADDFQTTWTRRWARRPRVVMLGLRGIPNVQGGVEKHVEMLGRELVINGWDVDVIGRSRYMSKTPVLWKGVSIFPIWAPSLMAFEAVVHTFLGVGFAAMRRPDILHIHAIGPAVLVPLARLLGLNVVVTHHGFDYDRQKWGPLARRMLRLGEFFGMRLARGRIGVSQQIADTMDKRYKVPVTYVPNGVNVQTVESETGILGELGLEPQRYILIAARIVPEKRQTDLIRAYAALGRSDIKLVIAGSAEFDTQYVRELHELASATEGVVLAGFQKGERLAELFARARLFVLPSSHEGMPIALLEAMSFGLPVLASDIVANLELRLPPDDYFPLGDIPALTRALDRKLAEPFSDEFAQARIRTMADNYSWSSVARRTIKVYNKTLSL